MIKVVNNLRLNDSERDVLNVCSELKLSVSGVKYSRGHDGDCMNANLKVGNKIKGTIWDDSWGGGFQYNGSDFNEFVSFQNLLKGSKELLAYINLLL